MQSSSGMSRLGWLIVASVGAGSFVAAADAGEPLRPGEFFYQFRDDVVLWSTASTRWGRGAYRLEAVPDDRNDQIIVSRAVDARQLPPVLSQWRDRVLRLYAWDGSSCTATITGFRLVGVARLVPPLAAQWNALRDLAKGDPAIGNDDWQDQTAMAEAAWNQGAHFLVATVDRPESCTAQAWARDAELPTPARAAEEPISEWLRALAIETFRALPAWQRLQRAYAQATDRRGEPDPSWDRRDHAQPHVQSFRLSSKGAERHVVSVYAVHDNPDVTRARRLWAIFELEGPADHPILLLRDVASGRAVPAGLELQAVIDLHDDGRAALMYSADASNGLMLEVGGSLVDQPLKRAPR
jgi:hypothetical protein